MVRQPLADALGVIVGVMVAGGTEHAEEQQWSDGGVEFWSHGLELEVFGLAGASLACS